MSITKEDQTKIASEIEQALRHWSSEIRAACDQRYGKNKVGHIIITFPYGGDVKASWISTARRSDVVKMLRHLANQIERPDARIILPN